MTTMMSSPVDPSATVLSPSDTFVHRHVGPSEDEVAAMLKAVGSTTLGDLIEEAIPAAVRSDRPLALDGSRGEHETTERLRAMAQRHPTAPTIYAAVAYNPNKRYAVSPEERRQLVAEMCAADDALRGRVQAVVVDGYAWRLAMRLRCARMYRGIRT